MAHTELQALLDDAVTKGVAPGFQCVVFTRDTILFHGASGLASLPSPTHPSGKPFTPSTLLWIASCTKISISLLVLHILERGLTNTGISLADLDNHEALVKVLPEFKHGSGSLVTKIIEGFEDKIGPDGKKVMKLRDVHGKVTLRMLLTHTAGTGYSWNHKVLSELYRPSDGSIPNNQLAPISGAIRDFEVPLVFEPGTSYHYGYATDWLGQFLVRATSKTLRQLFHEYLFSPLEIPQSSADLYISPELQKLRADIHVRDPMSPGGFRPISFNLYVPEHGPEEGKAYVAESGVFASMEGYTPILQAVLAQDPRILSEETWQMAMKDDLGHRGLKLPRPEWRTAMPDLTPDVEEFSKSTTEDGAGMNLLQCKVALTPTVSGRPAGSIAWGGLANTYYFIDPVTSVGAILGTQLFPFYDSQVIEVRDKLETLVYKILNATPG